jgi:DNA-directed RNA polymerase subunit beta'
MAVHLPISDEAQKEAKELICSSKNILKPADGLPTISLSQDMVLGIYFLTDFYNPKYPLINTESERQNEENVPTVARFSSKEAAYQAYENNEVEIKDKIVILVKGEPVITTVGRVIFNMVIPDGIDFINELYKKKHLKKLISKVFDEYDIDTTVKLADDLKDLGFAYSTISAVSVNIKDMIIPKEKEDMLKRGDQQIDQILSLFYKGFFSESEKHRKVVEVWTKIKAELEGKLKHIFQPGNDLYTMVDSGARGSQTHLTQICGMKGLVVNPKGDIIELPVKASFAEGLKPIEYFIAAHSGRKGKADTALRTAESGYLTRKLVDSSQEVIVREDDC